MNVSRYNKLIPTILGIIVQAIAVGILPSDVEKWAVILIAVLTAAGVYVAPQNTTPLKD